MASINFKGKTAVWNHHLSVPYHTLEKDKKNSLEGKNDTENLIIEGDNLLALKALLPKYQGQVKCIYIDPPYNTGNEGWVYNDNVNSPIIKNWVGEVVGKDDDDFVRHDKWLAMITPRLKLLSELLHQNGAILISIGKDEFANLKSLCDEVFGPQNFITSFVWINEGNTENQEEITEMHEYVLAYAKNIERLEINNVVDPNVPHDSKILRDFVENSLVKNSHKNPPLEITLPVGFPSESKKGKIKQSDNYEEFIARTKEIGYISRSLGKEYEARYPLYKTEGIIEDHKLVNATTVFSGWSASDKLKRFIANDCKPITEGNATIRFYLTKSGVINYRKEGRESRFIGTVLRGMGTTEQNKYQLESLGLDFDYPKPIYLIAYLISIFSSKNDIVLDSFAGSGTTAHSVMELNREDGGGRKFILVQLPEKIKKGRPAYDAGYRCVHEITRDRVKKVIKRDKLDVGFTYYTLGPSIDGKKILTGKNMPTWDVMAKYVHFLATGKPVDEVTMAKKTWEITATKKGTGVYLIYADTLDELKTLAITRDWLEAVKDKAGKKIVYAPACFLDKEILDEYNISFVQIPFNLFTRK